MLLYFAVQYDKHKLLIKQIVFYSSDTDWDIPCSIDTPTFKYSFELVNLRKLPYTYFLANSDANVNVVAVLADFGNEEPKTVVEKIFGTIRAKGELEAQTENLESLLLFRKFNKKFVEAMIFGITTPKEKSVLYALGAREATRETEAKYEILLKEAEAKAAAKARAEAEAKAAKARAEAEAKAQKEIEALKAELAKYKAGK
jgi:hypothetical protein